MNQMIDDLLREARVISNTGEAHCHLAESPYGWSAIVRDQEPDRGGPLTGEIIAAGHARSLTEAVQRCNASMKSRAAARCSHGTKADECTAGYGT